MDRLGQIAHILLKSEEALSTEEIARDLKVSVKTIRNDLKKLEDYCGKEGLTILKKSGVGVVIQGPEANKRILLTKLSRPKNQTAIYSTEGRHKYIIRRIVMEQQTTTVANLAEEMYVTVSTVYKDLKNVEDFLSAYDLKIIKGQDHILRLQGDEQKYRMAIANMIFEKKNELATIEAVSNKESRIEYHIRSQLQELIDLDYNHLESAIHNLEEALGFQFSQEAFISMIIHIAIAIKRIMAGKDILLDQETLANLVETKEYALAVELGKDLGSFYEIRMPEQEIGYITLHILGSKAGGESLVNQSNPQVDIGQLKEMSLASEIAKRMIATASDVLGVDLAEDDILERGLALHLRPTINRLKYGLTLRNPILENIKNQYPDIFGVAWIAGKILQKYTDTTVPESEIGYIALHIGAALERVRGKIKTLVICHSGIGTSQLLSARLRRTFKELEIIGITSSIRIEDELLNQADIILTTVPVRLETEKPIFRINPLFGAEDVKKVEWVINQEIRRNRQKSLQSMDQELFVRNKIFEDRRQLIDELCLSLFERDYIYPGFKESVLEREKIYPTEIGRGLVIPHGDPGLVKKSCLSVTVLKNRMKWETEYVEVIIFVLLSDDDLKYAKRIFSNLSEVMEDEKFLETLKGPRDQAMLLLNRILE